MINILFFLFSIVFISSSYNVSGCLESQWDMMNNIGEALGPGCHSITQVGGVLGPILVSTRSTNPIPTEALTLPLTVIRSDPEGKEISVASGLGAVALGAAAVGTMAYVANSSPQSTLGTLIRAYGDDRKQAKRAKEEDKNSLGTWLINGVSGLFSWDNAKKGATTVGMGVVGVGTAVAGNSYVQTQAIKYLHHQLKQEEKESISHEVHHDLPEPTRYDGSYTTPFGEYTFSELLEISQAEAALGKRGPFSDMLLYVIKNQDKIPLDAKKSLDNR